MKIFSLKTALCWWRIEPSLQTKWILKRKGEVTDKGEFVGWIPVGLFNSPTAAANSVAEGKTGELDWDTAAKEFPRSRYALDAWTKEEKAE